MVDNLIWTTEYSLSLAQAVSKVESSEHGAVVTFSGCVRETEDGQPIDAINYEAYREMAETELAKIAGEATSRWKVRVAVGHRIGRVPVGEASVVVACGGAHRGEAFAACRYVIDELKSRAPIWKVEFEKAEE